LYSSKQKKRLIANQRTRVNVSAICDMRQSGASLQEIADKVGKTRERVRQILIKNCGCTKHGLLSTEKLCRLLSLSRNRVLGLYQGNIIIPEAKWNSGSKQYLLWSPDTEEDVIFYYKTHRLCKICLHPVPKNRRTYCSEECRKEGQKYKYKDTEAKRRHLMSTTRYREKQRQLARARLGIGPKHQPEPLVLHLSA